MQIRVQHKVIDGAHIFTSGDPLGRGLCAGHLDERTARNDVAEQLYTLLRLNHGIENPCFKIVYED